MQTPGSHNGHSTEALTQHGWAHSLRGRPSPNGRTVRFDGPGDKPRSYSKTLTIDPSAPGGFVVADPTGKMDWRTLKNWCAEQAGLPAFNPGSKNSGRRSGKSHRPAGGPIVQEAEPAGFAPVGEAGAAAPAPLFRVLDADEALRTKVPDLVWHMAEWMPGNNVTLLGGNGGEGKSLLALQLAHVTRCGMPFFGRSVRAGAAVYYSAEESEDELAYRLQRISQTVLLGGVPENPLKLISMADKPALLAVPDGSAGEMKPTPALLALEELVREVEAVLLVVDASADVFGGDEINRAQVRSFISLLRGVAIRNQCAVLLLAHPSVAGMSDGRGYSGNTAWNNSVRARAFLSTPKTKEGAEIDLCLRQLELMKVNNAARGAKVLMRFEGGAFHQQNGMTDEGMSVEQQVKALTLLLELVQKACDQERSLSDKKNSPSYAPAVLAQEAKERGVTKAQMVWALNAGFAQKRLTMQDSRKGGRPVSRLVVALGGTGQ